MVMIEKINRDHETINVEHCLSEHTLFPHYTETEEEFIKGIEELCNTIGEENLISVQFLTGKNNEVNGCIITSKV